MSSCTISGLKHCGVQEPIEGGGSASAVHKENGEMGAEIQSSGGPFTEITFLNNGGTCALNGVTVPIEGTVVGVAGTGASSPYSGATGVFLPENEALTIGGSPATFTAIGTARMAGGGHPIAATTVT